MNLNDEQKNLITTYLEDKDVPSENIDEILISLDSLGGSDIKLDAPLGVSDEEIKLKIKEETDWRKRASLAALLISRNI